MEHLYQKLEAYSRGDVYPFHMPGHKRNLKSIDTDLPLERDITEIEGFDNLHHPEDLLKDAQGFVSEIYGTKESFYSVNGSTAALLSAVFAVVKKGGKLLVARNCHKAVYHAMYLRDIHPVYLYPRLETEFRINGGIPAEDVKEALENDPEIQAVLITSPTYDGVVSDVEKIAEVAHSYGIPLVVDEAHGAHFHFSDYFPAAAEDLGADVVIQSCHKTLLSMTQTAFLHRCSDRVDGKMLARYMGMFQSSSPSYILMASMDACLERLSRDGDELYQNYTKMLDEARRRLSGCKHIRLISPEIVGRSAIFDLDRSKLLFSTEYADVSGSELEKSLLERYHLQMEMAAENYVTALTAVGDTEEGFLRLCRAIEELEEEEEQKRSDSVKNKMDKKYSRKDDGNKIQLGINSVSEECMKDKSFTATLTTTRKVCLTKKSMETKSNPYPILRQINTISDAMDRDSESVFLCGSVGRISAEFVYLYPPGIPLVVPGEQITEELVKKIETAKRESLDLQGLMDYTGEMIRVLK